MQTANECLVCFMGQALKAVKLCTADSSLRRKILCRVGGMLDQFVKEASPPENAAHYYRFIARETGVPDPFAAIKKQSNQYALSLEPDARETIVKDVDPLLTAIKFAIGANVLDSASEKQLDFVSTFAACLQRSLDINDYLTLVRVLHSKPRVLFLADNCGEIVFDKLLVEQLLKLGCRVTVAVRNAPIINDATMVDAIECGLSTICKVITSGDDVPGTLLERCSHEFKNEFHQAECIISKGMGNYECLSEQAGPIFFLFTVKCSSVLRHLTALHPDASLQIGSPVLLANKKTRSC